MSQVFDVFAAAEGIAGFDQAADIIVAVAPFASLWVDAFQQLAGDGLLLPAIAERAMYLYTSYIALQ
jgi:hypothetical protein